MRVVLSGGGTGGHIFPALAVAEGLRALAPEIELLYIGGTTGMETEIVPATGVPFQTVTTKKLRKVLSFSTLGVLRSLLQGYREALTYMRAFGPDAVVGTGGYVAAATVLAGARLRVPILIHEGNAIPGRTNRFLARYARQVCVTFASSVACFPAGRTVATGLPLRAGMVLPSEIHPEDARRSLGMEPGKFTVVVVGGSQGAQAINTAVIETMGALGEACMQVLHVTGPKNIQAVRDASGANGLARGSGYFPVPFLDSAGMSAALRAADVIVCRGGISTLSEVTVNGLPAIIVPLPSAYADHQTANAREIVDGGAAEILPQAEMTAAKLMERLLVLREDTALRTRMADASRGLGRPHAAEDVAKLVLKMKAD